VSESDLPTTIEEAFDLSTSTIHAWEIAKIKYAVSVDGIVMSPHADEQSFEREFDIDDCYHVLNHGKAKTKDLPYNVEERQPGISYEGNLVDGRRFLVKVGWWQDRYTIVTAHEKRR